MDVFKFQDFRKLTRGLVSQMPGGGRGAYAKIADYLGMHTTSLSQILASKKPISLEAAVGLCEFFSLTEVEMEYFLLLVQKERAGTVKLREFFKRRLDKICEDRRDLSKVVPSEHVLTLEQEAIFYSDWHFSAIRVLSSIDGFQSVEKISERLNLPRGATSEKINFLVECGLCMKVDEGIRPGPAYTHLPATSPLISRHHANWRVQAMQRHPNLSHSEIAYSSLMSISDEDALKIQDKITDFVKGLNKIRGESKCETLRCISIDWFAI